MFLIFVSIAMKSHHEQGTTYKSKQLIGAGLQFQRFSPFLSQQEGWQHAGRQDDGVEAECSASLSQGSQEETVFQGPNRRVSSTLAVISKPTSTVMQFLQQSHSST